MSSLIGNALEKRLANASSLEAKRNLNLSFFSIIRFNCLRFIPKICKCSQCSKKTIQEELFEKSYQKLRHEIDILRFLKEIRVIKSAVRQKITSTQWKNLKRDSERKAVMKDLMSLYGKFLTFK